MNITSEYPVMVFKNENGYYSLSLSDKKQDGKYVNWYKNCQFKKGVEVSDRTNIKIKKAWFKCNDVNGRKYEYIFISEFEIVEEQKEQPKEENPFATIDPFQDIKIDDEDLPY